jgi:hypothetical protein
VDQVHSTVDQWCDRVHGGPAGGADNRCGGASLTRGAWALEVAGGLLTGAQEAMERQRDGSVARGVVVAGGAWGCI